MNQTGRRFEIFRPMLAMLCFANKRQNLPPMNQQIGTTKKIFCNNCRLQTPHELSASSKREHIADDQDTDVGYPVWWEEWQYSLWVCTVCNTGCLEEQYNSFELDSSEEVRELPLSYFPPRQRLVKRRFANLAARRFLSNAYSEVIDSYNSGMPLLCAAGIRMLLEGICIDQGIADSGKTRSLTEKINALVEQKLVSKQVGDDLQATLKAIGDDAIHRLEKSPDAELIKGIEVIENLIAHIYKETEYALSMHAQQLAQQRGLRGRP